MDKQFTEDLVAEVRSDYETRASERRQFESQWQLNANFVIGNQYCRIGVRGEVEDTEKDYYWQEREVFNHIATILETRLAKLSRVRPRMSVLPASGDDGDIKTAKASGKILESAYNKLKVDEIVGKATMWSELTGSAFYKVVWDKAGGRRVGTDERGRAVYEGDVRIDVCPPYEVLPDSLICQSVEECVSIIHAKAVSVEDVKRIWGKTVEPEETDVVSLSNISVIGGMGLAGAVSKIGRGRKKNRVLVIERYTRPTADKPDGELVIVAGKQLLHYGALPYFNGPDGERALPFIQQNSISRAGCFYGMSMVDETSALLQYKDIKGKLLLEKQADRKKTPESLEEVPKLCSSLREAVAAYEEKLIWQALEAAHGNISEAARILDVPRQTLQRKASQLRGEKAKEKREKEI